MTTQTPANAAQPTPKRKKHLSRAVKAGAAITTGILLISSAGSLASWSQTVKGQDTNIQAGTMSIELTGTQTAFDVSDGASTAKAIDVSSFLVSPGDAIRVVEPVSITVEGDNLRAKLTGTSPGVTGDLPIDVVTSLVEGAAGGTTDLASATVVATTKTTNSVGAEAIVDLGSGAKGAHGYTIVQEIFVPFDADISAAGLGALVSGSSWTLSQYRGAVVAPPVVPEVDLNAAWVIPDPALAGAVRSSLKLGAGEVLTMGHAKALTDLTNTSAFAGVRDLRGLEKAVNLERLRIHHEVENIAAISGLVNVQYLNLAGMGISDISFLSGMVGLTHLDLAGTTAVELAPLAGMQQLRILNLSDTPVSDLAPIAHLRSIEWLRAGHTQISDLAPLVGWVQLRALELSGASLTDISALSTLTGLTSLALFNNIALTDLTPLSSLTGLTLLDLEGSTALTDLTPLSTLTGLTDLNLDGSTALTDISPLAGLSMLANVFLAKTGVTDFGPVAHVESVSK